jgi:type 1 fimbriae regulatory protein FimB
MAWLAIRTQVSGRGFPCLALPHLLRLACDFALTDQVADTRFIQDYLGHLNIQPPVIYPAVNLERFERLWR